MEPEASFAEGGFPCRACASRDVRHRFRIRGFDIVACRTCGSLTTAFSMDEGRASSFYDHGYFHGGDYQDYQASEPQTRQNFENLVERLRAIGPSRGRLLELGCAYGYFLDAAKSQWEVTGLDISPAAVEAARSRHGASALCGDLSRTALPRDHYDWIVGWDMVEHVDSPREYMQRAFGLLRPGGHLALTTGDVGSPAARLLGRYWRLLTPPSHLTFFTRDGMTRLLRDAGFARVTFSTAGYERSLDFAVFRLLGPGAYDRLVRHWARLQAVLKEKSFFVDLGDIMFVLATKDEAPGLS